MGDQALGQIAAKLTEDILRLQDKDGCWNVLQAGDKYYPAFQYYCPNYRSTLWTLLLLADIGSTIEAERLRNPFNIMAAKFLDKESGIYTIGKSHFPIPCLNGNMLFLHSHFGLGDDSVVDSIIDFFEEYQRFDDGAFRTPKEYPYFRNRSCYGSHTCYWGVVRLLKGLSYMPEGRRSAKAKVLLNRCIEFILLHEVCFSSGSREQLLHPMIGKLGFPNMYKSDYLEILLLLKREKIRDSRLNRALTLLKSAGQSDGRWLPGRKIGKLAVPVGEKIAGAFLTQRAEEVIGFYG